MSTLKALKTRIQSVQSTRKITSAMYMVAAAKFRRTQKGYDAAKLYAKSLENILSRMSAEVFDEVDHPLVKGPTNGKTLIILLAADRGLCGGFNGQLFRKFKSVIQRQTTPWMVLPVGKKACDFVNSGYRDHGCGVAYEGITDITYQTLDGMINQLEELFRTEGISNCMMIYNEYNSPLQQTVECVPFLPLNAVPRTNVSASQPSVGIADYIPSEPAFIQAFLMQYIQSTLWSFIKQTGVGEFAARMAAMDNATKNCDDMIHQLKLKYNQNRQARITKELIEIISGAEALQKG